jgi:hypothetical protein
MRFNAVKNISPRMHFERRYGSQKQAIQYCKKGQQLRRERSTENSG